jgi:hypothetical protein
MDFGAKRLRIPLKQLVYLKQFIKLEISSDRTNSKSLLKPLQSEQKIYSHTGNLLHLALAIYEVTTVINTQ